VGGIAVVLVEDVVSYHQALQAALPQYGDLYVAAAVQQPEQAGQVARAAAAAAALVDVELPDDGGVRALASIREMSPGTGLAAITRTDDPVVLGRCVEAGAAAVLHKAVDLGEMCRVLLRVAAGGNALPVTEMSGWLRAASAVRLEHWRASVLAEQLTGREQQVLGLLAAGADTRAISHQLAVSPDTAATHVRNLLSKIGAGSRLEAVLEAQRLGLVDPPAPLARYPGRGRSAYPQYRPRSL
jgi:two-component system NarL family response regulator